MKRNLPRPDSQLKGPFRIDGTSPRGLSCLYPFFFMKKINEFFLSIACLALVTSMIMAVANMILRPFGHPITGSFELMGLGSAIVTALGLGYSYEKKAHIAVDILFKHLHKSLRKILSLAGRVVCSLFFLAISWKMLLLAINFMENGELSETLCIPFYPVTMLVALGVLILAMNLLSNDLRDTFTQDQGDKK